MFSYLAGCDLFHKIALTCKDIRQRLPNSGLLDQMRVITVKFTLDEESLYFNKNSFNYALALADSIQIQIAADQFAFLKKMCSYMQFLQENKSKDLVLDVILL